MTRPGLLRHVDTVARNRTRERYLTALLADLHAEWSRMFTDADDIRTSSKAYRLFFAEQVETMAGVVERWDGPDGSWLAVADGLRGSQGNRTRGEQALLVDGLITGALLDQYGVRTDDLIALGNHDPVYVRRHGIEAPGIVSPTDGFWQSPMVAELARAIDDTEAELSALDTVRGARVEWSRAVPKVAPLRGFDVRAALGGLGTVLEKVAA
jgi:hypothetical protein